MILSATFHVHIFIFALAMQIFLRPIHLWNWIQVTTAQFNHYPPRLVCIPLSMDANGIQNRRNHTKPKAWSLRLRIHCSWLILKWAIVYSVLCTTFNIQQSSNTTAICIYRNKDVHSWINADIFRYMRTIVLLQDFSNLDKMSFNICKLSYGWHMFWRLRA